MAGCYVYIHNNQTNNQKENSMYSSMYDNCKYTVYLVQDYINGFNLFMFLFFIALRYFKSI